MEIEEALNYALKLGSEFAEIRYCKMKETSIQYVDGSLKSISSNLDEGIAVRVFIKGAWGFSATPYLSPTAIKESVEKAFKIAKVVSSHVKKPYSLKEFKGLKATSFIAFKEDFENISYEEKLNLVKQIDSSIRSYDERIKSNTVNYSENKDEIIVVNSFGTNLIKKEIYLRVTALAISLESGIRGRGYESIGGVGGYELIKEFKAEEIGIKSAEKAIEQLEAKSVKPGSYVCLMDPILVGVFAHEAIGHPAEGDGIVEKDSVLEGKLGEKIASDLVTIIDNPLVEKSYGYFEYDDEGFPARARYIIKNGVLNEYLHNIETSSILGLPNNGAARADSFLNPPIVRMSNIYFNKGDMSFEELLEGIEIGIYAKGFEYGYVVPSNGQYTFKCERGYLIEKGEIKTPLRDLSLSGVILETLKNVEGIGKDLEIRGTGQCGKEGQFVRVGDGGPHVRIKGMTVSGVA